MRFPGRPPRSQAPAVADGEQRRRRRAYSCRPPRRCAKYSHHRCHTTLRSSRVVAMASTVPVLPVSASPSSSMSLSSLLLEPRRGSGFPPMRHLLHRHQQLLPCICCPPMACHPSSPPRRCSFTKWSTQAVTTDELLKSASTRRRASMPCWIRRAGSSR